MGGPPFEFPFFHNYPPYFTLQPVQETRDKQSSLWQALILQYCRSQKVYIVLAAGEDENPLFVNNAIDRRANREARTYFLSGLVESGRAAWLDKEKNRCLILWKTPKEWAAAIYDWARSFGLNDSVFTIDDLSAGDEVQGTELEGLPREIIVPALKLLEAHGQARLFKGATPGEEGVKFLAR